MHMKLRQKIASDILARVKNVPPEIVLPFGRLVFPWWFVALLSKSKSRRNDTKSEIFKNINKRGDIFLQKLSSIVKRGQRITFCNVVEEALYKVHSFEVNQLKNLIFTLTIPVYEYLDWR